MAISVKVLSMEELQVGMLVTVISSGSPMAPVFEPVVGEGPEDVMERVRERMAEMQAAAKYDSIGGMPLVIRHLEHPYISATHYGCRTCQPYCIDARQVKLRTISKEYAEAMRPSRPWWKFWGRGH